MGINIKLGKRNISIPRKNTYRKTNLNHYRTEQGLSLTDLAIKTDVSAQTLCSIEAETSTPSMGLIIDLCKALNITPNELIWNGIHDKENPDFTIVE